MAHEPVQDTDPTIGRLVSDASRDLSSLVRNEIRLAKSEIQISVKAGGLGIAMFVAAGFFAMMALQLLFVVFMMVETRGRSLESVSHALERT